MLSYQKLGKPTEADSSRFFGIARGSSMECGDTGCLQGLKLADPELLLKGSQLIERVVLMLTKMINLTDDASSRFLWSWTWPWSSAWT